MFISNPRHTLMIIACKTIQFRCDSRNQLFAHVFPGADVHGNNLAW